MTREHLIEDIRNVMAMVGEVERGGGNAERVRRAFEGLARHAHAEGDVPERVVHCLDESARVLEQAGASVDTRNWQYARTCLEAALQYAQEAPAGPA